MTKIITDIFNGLQIIDLGNQKYTFFDGDAHCPEKMQGYVLPPDPQVYQDIYWMCIDCTDFYTSEEIIELWQRGVIK